MFQALSTLLVAEQVALAVQAHKLRLKVVTVVAH
jgi:hypothetical protein